MKEFQEITTYQWFVKQNTLLKNYICIFSEPFIPLLTNSFMDAFIPQIQ